VFQIDADRRITFTNDRFHVIVGRAPAATSDAQFAAVVPDDLSRLDAVLAAVLADEPVDDLDIRVRTPSDAPASDAVTERVCVLAMRPLTDGAGTVTGAIGCLSDITDRVQLRRELEIRATVDGLTSCLNRATILTLIADTLAGQAESGAPTAIMYVDLDRFKAINDSLGHAAGDRVLEIAARKLRAAVREADRVGRVGGDEFLVVCPDVEDPATALDIGERLARTLTTDVTVGTDTIELRASIGVAWTDRPIDADAFVAQADAAMYASKGGGNSDATLFDSRGGRARPAPG
jgi:diguanylate cyclase (GGDEF)-like protein